MKKVLKIARDIISYALLTVAIIAFIPPVLLYALSAYIDDPKKANEIIQLVIKGLKGEDVK